LATRVACLILFYASIPSLRLEQLMRQNVVATAGPMPCGENGLGMADGCQDYYRASKSGARSPFVGKDFDFRRPDSDEEAQRRSRTCCDLPV